MTHHSATAEQRRSGFKFVNEIINELKKVVWLSRRELIYLTFLVLIVSIVMGLIMGAFDYGFARFVKDILLGK